MTGDPLVDSARKKELWGKHPGKDVFREGG
jgi:hypothetical protein